MTRFVVLILLVFACFVCFAQGTMPETREVPYTFLDGTRGKLTIKRAYEIKHGITILQCKETVFDNKLSILCLGMLDKQAIVFQLPLNDKNGT